MTDLYRSMRRNRMSLLSASLVPFLASSMSMGDPHMMNTVRRNIPGEHPGLLTTHCSLWKLSEHKGKRGEMSLWANRTSAELLGTTGLFIR